MTPQATKSQPARDPALERAFSRIRHAARDLPDGRIMVIVDRGGGCTTGYWVRAVATDPAELERVMQESPHREKTG